MNERELSTLVQARIADALGNTSGELSQLRQESYDFYMGELYGNEQKGQSQVVTRECLEVVEWMLPSLIRIFLAGSTLVKFEPIDEDDEEAAEQETDLVNHILLKQNNIFILFHNWFKDALINPNGYIKVWADEQETVTKENYKGLVLSEVLELEDSDEYEAVSSEVNQIVVDGEAVDVYDIEYKRTKKEPVIRIENVPPEELLLDSDHADISLDDAEFVCHKVERSYSFLVSEGYDRAVLDRLNDDEDGEYNDERLNRRVLEDELPDGASELDPSMKKYWVYEAYLKVDYDGDGIAELRKVTQIGKDILDNEEIDYIPFEALGTLPMPHKHLALSLVDLVKDIQLVNSTLWRQGLDNLYRVNYPRTIIGKGVNMDDLLTHRPNQVIRANDVSQVTIEPTQPVMGQLLPMIDWVNSNKDARTGVTKFASGLNPEVLAKTTAAAFQGAQDNANQRVEMITRIFSETGVKGLIKKVHRLVREHGFKEKAIKIRGEFVPVNADEWRERENMTVMVGLGYSSRNEQAAAALKIIELQREASTYGLANASHVYNALEKLIEAMDWKETGLYFVNPNSEDYQPPEPPQDPQIEAIKLQQQIEISRMQQKQSEFTEEMRIKQEGMVLDHQRKMTEMELKYQINVPGAAV